MHRLAGTLPSWYPASLTSTLPLNSNCSISVSIILSTCRVCFPELKSRKGVYLYSIVSLCLLYPVMTEWWVCMLGSRQCLVATDAALVQTTPAVEKLPPISLTSHHHPPPPVILVFPQLLFVSSPCNSNFLLHAWLILILWLSFLILSLSFEPCSNIPEYHPHPQHPRYHLHIQTSPLLFPHFPHPFPSPSHSHSPLHGFPPITWEVGGESRKLRWGWQLIESQHLGMFVLSGFQEGVGVGIPNLPKKGRYKHYFQIWQPDYYQSCCCLYFMTLSCSSETPHATLLGSPWKWGKSGKTAGASVVGKLGYSTNNKAWPSPSPPLKSQMNVRRRSRA